MAISAAARVAGVANRDGPAIAVELLVDRRRNLLRRGGVEVHPTAGIGSGGSAIVTIRRGKR